MPPKANGDKPLTIGAGAVIAAHTKKEFVLKADRVKAAEHYVELVRRLLG